MKRIICALCLFCVLLASCAVQDAAPSAGASSVQESIGQISEDASAPDEPPAEELPLPEEPFFASLGQEALPANPVIPPICTSTETPHLYDFPLELPDSEGFSVLAGGDSLYLPYWNEAPMCRAYSLATGELLYEITLPAQNTSGVLDDGRLWTVDLKTEEVVFYGKDGTAETVLVGEERTVCPQSAAVHGNGKYLLAVYGDAQNPVLTALDTGVRTELAMDCYTYTQPVQWQESFLLENTQGEPLLVDPASLTCQPIRSPDSVYAYYGGLCSYAYDRYLLLGELSAAPRLFFAPLENGESLLAIRYGFAALQNYQGSSLRFVNLDESTVVSTVAFGGDCFGIHAVFCGNGTVFLMEISDGKTRTYLYDLYSASLEEGTPLDSVITTEEEIGELTDALAQQTESTTGVELVYGSRGNDFVLYDYVGHAETDPFAVYTAVKKVSHFLALYPEGMLRESYEETHKGLRIYLCGTLYGVTQSALGQAGAVTTDYEGYIVIAIDVHNDLLRDLSHEFSHVFDRRIEYVSDQTGVDWMQTWIDATPIDGYTYSYDDYTDNYRYTAWHEDSPDRVWYVDEYARTFPTEDRARLMEYMWDPQKNTWPDVFSCPHLRDKMELYCSILRACFPSCDREEPLHWEAWKTEEE